MTMQDWVELPLTKGKSAKIDKQDMLIVGRWRWCASGATGSRQYAVRFIRTAGEKRRCVSLHRWIMQPAPGMQVDHINGDTLDNRRANLRLATPKQNCANRALDVREKAPFVGVFRRRGATGRMWRASIGTQGRKVFLGSFRSPEDAARAYDAAVVRLRGEFAVTNFPMGVGRSIYQQ